MTTDEPEGQHPDQRAGTVAGITAYVVWGLLTIYWKQLHRFNAFELIGWRITASAVVMAIILTATGNWRAIGVVRRNRAVLTRVAVAAVFLTVNWTSYVWAVVHGHVLETALGYFIAPLGTVLIGVFVLHEPLRLALKIALGFAAVAVVVLTISYGGVPWLAFLIAISWTTYGYIKKHIPLTPVESMAAESFILLGPALAVAAVFATHADSIPHSASHKELVFAVFTGLATAGPLMLFAYAAQRMPLTIIGPMQYIVPSLNFFIGWLIYDESLPPTRLLGFALVWIGLIVLTADSLRRAHLARST
ncbi:MAG TPA: EamA family transporter RarD [Ilumatobacteraceae bacterium]|nr:EamA family transporter RarD [Ilumatobacteraceae bacterium]HRB04107.1 EamA family transporter RarD [Ilumatobacteraceae bacterium]